MNKLNCVIAVAGMFGLECQAVNYAVDSHSEPVYHLTIHGHDSVCAYPPMRVNKLVREIVFGALPGEPETEFADAMRGLSRVVASMNNVSVERWEQMHNGRQSSNPACVRLNESVA